MKIKQAVKEGGKTGYDIIKLLYIISSNSILITDNESYHNCLNCQFEYQKFNILTYLQKLSYQKNTQTDILVL